MEKNKTINKISKISIIVVLAIIVGLLIFSNSTMFSGKSLLTSSQDVVEIEDLNKIDEFTSLYKARSNESVYLTYDDVISMLGEGTISYPDPKDELVKVAYWSFEKDGYEYYLDTIYFDNQLVNVETRLSTLPNSLPNSKIENFKEVQDDIISAADYTELSKIIGAGTVINKSFNTDSFTTAWSFNNRFLLAEISTDTNDIINLNTAGSLDVGSQNSASCH